VDDESAYGDSDKQEVEHLIIDGALCTLSAIPRGWSDMVLFSAMKVVGDPGNPPPGLANSYEKKNK
jgi:hypothetical protein